MMKAPPLISAPCLVDNIEFIKPVAEWANNLDISHLSHDQQILLTQLATQFKLTNSNKIIGRAADYDHNKHSESSLTDPDTSQEKTPTLTLTSFLGGGGQKKPIRCNDLHRNLAALERLFFA